MATIRIIYGHGAPFCEPISRLNCSMRSSQNVVIIKRFGLTVSPAFTLFFSCLRSLSSLNGLGPMVTQTTQNPHYKTGIFIQINGLWFNEMNGIDSVSNWAECRLGYLRTYRISNQISVRSTIQCDAMSVEKIPSKLNDMLKFVNWTLTNNMLNSQFSNLFAIRMESYIIWTVVKWTRDNLTIQCTLQWLSGPSACKGMWKWYIYFFFAQ